MFCVGCDCDADALLRIGSIVLSKARSYNNDEPKTDLTHLVLFGPSSVDVSGYWVYYLSPLVVYFTST